MIHLVNRLAISAILIVLLVRFVELPGEIVGQTDLPFTGKGFKCLIIEESADRSKLPLAQFAIFGSGNVAEYMQTHCSKDEKGNPDFRIFDKDQPLANEKPIWQKAMNYQHDGVPWLMASNGKKGISMPLPLNETSFMEVVKKYGGK